MRGLNLSGPKFLRHQISWGPKKSGAQMWSGTISVVAQIFFLVMMLGHMFSQIVLLCKWGIAIATQHNLRKRSFYNVAVDWRFMNRTFRPTNLILYYLPKNSMQNQNKLIYQKGHFLRKIEQFDSMFLCWQSRNIFSQII